MCRCSVYWLLILRDQPVVDSLGLICPVAASGHNSLALIRQGGLNPLTVVWHSPDSQKRNPVIEIISKIQASRLQTVAGAY